MALKRVSKNGFGQVELNNVAFQRDGSIEAQCRLSEDFKVVPAENGMILGIDNRTRTVHFPSDQTLMYGLNYSTEHMYDNRKKGLKDFKLNEGDFYPRLGYLVVGDKFTSNTLAYSDEEFETEELLFAASLLYGGVSELGAILVSATPPTEGPVLKVVSKTTMPDGQRALKFQVIEYLTPVYVEEEEEVTYEAITNATADTIGEDFDLATINYENLTVAGTEGNVTITGDVAIKVTADQTVKGFGLISELIPDGATSEEYALVAWNIGEEAHVWIIGDATKKFTVTYNEVEYTIDVSGLNWEEEEEEEEDEVEIPPVTEPVVPDAPKDLVGVSPTDANDADGKITGVDDTMEWQADGDIDWTPVGEATTEIENLASGTYYIRYKAVGETPASESATVIIEPFDEG